MCGGQGIPVFQTVSPVARGVYFQQHPREAGIWPSARVNNQKKCPAGLLQPDIFEPVLLTQAEFLDQCAVFEDILLGVVGEEAFTLTNHSEQGTAGRVIFRELSQVAREALDTVGQESYLYFHVACVVCIFTVLPGDFSDFFLVVIDCHFLNFNGVKEKFTGCRFQRVKRQLLPIHLHSAPQRYGKMLVIKTFSHIIWIFGGYISSWRPHRALRPVAFGDHRKIHVSLHNLHWSGTVKVREDFYPV